MKKNKKLGWLLQPGAGVYFVIMLGFVIAAGLLQYYVLAGAELAITAVMFALYLFFKNRRREQLLAFVQKSLEEVETAEGAKPPFPMLAVRLADKGVLYANDAFIKLTGFQDTFRERYVQDVIPGLQQPLQQQIQQQTGLIDNTKLH